MTQQLDDLNALLSDHKSRKRDDYWRGLVAGDTGLYKAKAIDDLIHSHFPKTARSILDIGCGTSEIALAQADQLGVSKILFMDYDAAVLDKLKAKVKDPRAAWMQADILELGPERGTFDFVLLLDMLHEVYSFYGRPARDIDQPIDHALGLECAERALANVASIVAPGGGMIITDNILCEEDGTARVRLNNAATKAAVRVFLDEYKTKKIRASLAGDILEINTRDFCILLTQYNKIKAGDRARWNVEKLETHQYMTDAEYRQLFERLGFAYHRIIGTPPEAEREWAEDFTMESGLDAVPPKRISLLAVKQ